MELCWSTQANKIIKGDGNCYFRAISYTISGTEDFHDKVTETMCDYITVFLKKGDQECLGHNFCMS